MLKTLLGVQLRALLSSFGRSKKGGQQRSVLLVIGLLLFCGGCFAFLFYNIFSLLGGYVIGTDYEWVFFAFLGTVVFVIDFVLTIFTAKAQLFEAKDNEFLLSLPVKPRDILISRMLLLVLTDFVLEAFIAGSALAAYVIIGGFRLLSFLLALLSLVFMPLLALSLACLVGWLLSLLTSRMSNPAIFSTVLSLVFLALYFLAVMKGEQALIRVLEEDIGRFARVLTYAFFPFFCLGRAIAGANLLWFLAYAALMLLPFVIVCSVLAVSFLSLVTRRTGAKTRHLRHAEKQFRMRTPLRSSLAKEFRHLVSSSAYMLNAGISLVFTVAFGIGSFFIPWEAFGAIFPEESVPAILILTLCFFACTGSFTAPSLAIEGKQAELLLSLPVTGNTVLSAKLMMHLLIVLPVSLFSSVAVVIALRPGLLWALLLIFAPVAAHLLAALAGLVFALRHPRFDYPDDAHAVKQSLAVLMTMLVSFLMTVLSGVAGAVIGHFTGYYLLGAAVGTLLFLLGDILLALDLRKTGTRRFSLLLT